MPGVTRDHFLKILLGTLELKMFGRLKDEGPWGEILGSDFFR